ncbi:MAG: 16S rRNA (cytidine(1402)-2'-O)-methyltransferase [Limnochordia bacterium]|jgi:16S rRNA (cytidine1402-2'-O)-methyltransferase
MAGELYVCATPIGNLEDITLRALRILGEANLIAAEDTQRTRVLLAHYDIAAPLISYNEHNRKQRLPVIMEKLKEGGKVVLVSDAGTPGIADPGPMLVAEARKRGFPVIPLPGPSALSTALSICGLGMTQFTFTGFLPRRAGERERLLMELRQSGRGVVCYESPHRIEAALASLAKVWPDAKVAFLRELTKIYEEVLVGSPGQIAAELKARPRRGEMVLVIEGDRDGGQERTFSQEQIREKVVVLMEVMDKKQAIKEAAAELGIPKRIVYRAVIDLPGRGKMG